MGAYLGEGAGYVGGDFWNKGKLVRVSWPITVRWRGWELIRKRSACTRMGIRKSSVHLIVWQLVGGARGLHGREVLWPVDTWEN